MSLHIDQTDRDRVLEATDLVTLIGEQVPLKKKGREFVGLCPFHDDHTPSMHVVPHKGLYKCFSCGAGHNAIDFVMNFHRMEFRDALKYLAERAGITLNDRPEREEPRGSRKVDLLEANKVATGYFRIMLGRPGAGEAARKIIDERRMAPEIVEAFQLGAAPDQWDGFLSILRKKGYDLAPFRAAGLLRDSSDGSRTYDYFRNRLIFPICDQLGRPVAFGARKLNPEDEPKYLNSPETSAFNKSRTLYGLHLARKAISDANTAIVCEGYTDVIAMHQAGIRNAVATLGTSLTAEHAQILKRMCDTVVLLYDGDEAGQKAAERAVEVFFREPIDVEICVLPGGQDPDDLLRTEGGREALLHAVNNGVDALEYLVQRFRATLDRTESLSGRQKLVEGFFERLGHLGFNQMSGVRKRLVLPVLAQALNVSMRDLEQLLPKQRAKITPAGTVDRRDRDVESKPAADASDIGSSPNAVTRARRQSEFDLLAILLHAPVTHREHVNAGDGHHLPVTELFPPDALRNADLRAVYEPIHSRLEEGEAIAVHDLTGALAPALHAIVSDLVFRGEMLCGTDDGRAIELLHLTSRALIALDDRESARQRFDELRRAPANGNALLELIEERRRLGENLAALPRGLRT